MNSQADIDHVTLIYGTSADFLCASTSARQDIPFTLTPMIYMMWTWDLNLSGILPLGSEIWWQWELHDASGATTLTDVKKLTIEDPALHWQKLQQGNVTVYWGEGDASFGSFILNETVTDQSSLLSPTNWSTWSPPGEYSTAWAMTCQPGYRRSWQSLPKALPFMATKTW